MNIANSRKGSIYVLIILIIAMLSFPLITVRASTETEALQVYITEQTLTIITDVELGSKNLKCTISNQSAEITDFGALTDENALIKTTVLVDISTSMPIEARSKVIAVLNKVIELKLPNEEYKLVAFGGGLNTIHEFSADRYDLANAVESIKFDGNESEIYDAIYRSIPGISPSGETPTFFRTIVFTDGVDNTTRGITKEELFLKLQSEYYPVDVVAVSEKEAAEDKELSAISRISGGRYFSLDPGTDATTLTQKLDVSGYYYFEVSVPAPLLDGSIRQVDISDGARTVSADVKFPVFNVQNVDTTQPTPETSNEGATEVAAQETAFAPESPSSQLPTEIDDQDQDIATIPAVFGNSTIAIVIGALIIVAALIIILVAVRNKKKSNSQQHIKPSSAEGRKGDSGSDLTEYYEADSMDEQFTIKLSSANDPSKTWTIPIGGEVLIGRATHCNIILDDKSVSREQCKIFHQGAGVFVEHIIGATNKTTLNGANLSGSSPLSSGDKLKFGRETLQVDYIQILGRQIQNPIQPDDPGKGMTERFFTVD